jgi:hypothetical protein
MSLKIVFYLLLNERMENKKDIRKVLKDYRKKLLEK